MPVDKGKGRGFQITPTRGGRVKQSAPRLNYRSLSLKSVLWEQQCKEFKMYRKLSKMSVKHSIIDTHF